MRSESREQISEVTPVYSSFLGFTKERFYLPDSIIDVDLRGNIVFPQMFTAQSAMTGSEIIELVASKKLTWEQYDKAKLAPGQLDTLREGASRAHDAYSIKSKAFGPRALHNVVIKGPKRNIINAATHFALWAETGEIITPKKVRAKDRKVLHALFEDSDYASQLQVLQQVWQGAADVFQTDGVKTLSKEYREVFRSHLSNSARPAYVESAAVQLGDLIKEGIVSQQFATDVPAQVIDVFVGDLRTL